jgi:hypothetical protein
MIRPRNNRRRGLKSVRHRFLGWFRAGLASALMLIMLSVAGCTTWGRPAASEPAPEARQGMSAMRPPGKEGQLLGLDERSREIERSLGVR